MMISHGVEISIVEGGGEMVRVLSLGCCFLFFFFCNHAFIVFRYKKPHAALAMERTKPINQKHKTKESYGTSKYPLSRRVLLRRADGLI